MLFFLLFPCTLLQVCLEDYTFSSLRNHNLFLHPALFPNHICVRLTVSLLPREHFDCVHPTLNVSCNQVDLVFNFEHTNTTELWKQCWFLFLMFNTHQKQLQASGSSDLAWLFLQAKCYVVIVLKEHTVQSTRWNRDVCQMIQGRREKFGRKEEIKQ